MAHWADRSPSERPVPPPEDDLVDGEGFNRSFRAGGGVAAAQPRARQERLPAAKAPQGARETENATTGRSGASVGAQRVRVAPPVVPLGIPEREALVQLALDTYKLALDNETTYTNRRGDHVTKAAPDFKAACEAIRVAAQIAGYTMRGGEPHKAGAAGEKDAETALKDMARLRARAVVK